MCKAVRDRDFFAAIGGEAAWLIKEIVDLRSSPTVGWAADIEQWEQLACRMAMALVQSGSADLRKRLSHWGAVWISRRDLVHNAREASAGKSWSR